MSNFILSRSGLKSSTRLAALPPLYPTLYAFRAASVNSGINRGLRRSKGVGFRGQEKSRTGASDNGPSTGLNRRSADPPHISQQQITRDGRRGDSPQKSAKGEREGNSLRIRRGKKVIKGEEDKSRKPSHAARSSSRNHSYGDGKQSSFKNTASDEGPAPREKGFGRGSQDRHANSKDRYPSLSATKPSYESRTRDRASNSEHRYPASRRHDDDISSSGPKVSPAHAKRIPLSIPYTTPASEFLYGTSVVEAALNSQRDPRRKLYKLYIYTGENRDSVDPARLERLARRKGIEVARVGGDWLRLMDKMSGGRPHNGYVLEASPLPRLPVMSLGELAEQDGESGFKVDVEHQSREDAAVNGTSDFIKLPRNSSGRKPFVLLLDSIEDPGNLGGIIRTASFLGVTAVAISVRNSASFTPVVLKASAGASENVTLFSVNKPAGFVANSKLAGWKIFAAVPPSRSKERNVTPAVFADDLEDPLSEDPCILMLGGEGEGLRMNLRSKADVDLSIRGSGQSHNVDSLNVSVAAGILCNAFLRRNQGKKRAPLVDQAAESESASRPERDLF